MEIGGKDWGKQVSPRLAIGGILAIVLVVLVVVAGTTMVTKIEPGYIGVVVNNITGAIETQTQPGLVYHLPFGMTDVYTIDSRLQVFEMIAGGAAAPPARRGSRVPRESSASRGDRVKVKTLDGGDVFMDLTINYRINPAMGESIAKEVGVADAYKQELMKAYARSLLRDSLGVLTIVEISDPSIRNGKLGEIQVELNERLGPRGIVVDAVSATNFSFNARYEELIKERKSVDQEIRNQAAAQETARRTQETAIKEATREKNVELRKVQGQMQKRLIEARGLAEKQKKSTEGEAYRKKKEGDRAFAVAKAEAEAIEAEGLKRAEGILATSNAYKDGGLALVLEALAEKYAGRVINGRPYNLESTIDRLRIEEPEVRGAAVQSTRKGGAR